MSLQVFTACFAAAKVHHTFVGESSRILVSRVRSLVLTALSFSLSASARQMLQVCDRDDVSQDTLPAWPGQGYDAIWLSSGLLVPFVFLSVLGYYFASAIIGSL